MSEKKENAVNNNNNGVENIIGSTCFMDITRPLVFQLQLLSFQ